MAVESVATDGGNGNTEVSHPTNTNLEIFNDATLKLSKATCALSAVVEAMHQAAGFADDPMWGFIHLIEYIHGGLVQTMDNFLELPISARQSAEVSRG
jgi:hypothetical protein